jgi:hypothetical protein
MARRFPLVYDALIAQDADCVDAEGIPVPFITRRPLNEYWDSVPRLNQDELRQAVSGGLDPECPICQVEFGNIDNEVVRLPCQGNHVFCLECARTWFLQHTTCPMFRDSLNRGEGWQVCPVDPTLYEGPETYRTLYQPNTPGASEEVDGMVR